MALVISLTRVILANSMRQYVYVMAPSLACAVKTETDGQTTVTVLQRVKHKLGKTDYIHVK